MIRKVIKIDEEKCNGCGICVSACHEGAIGIVNSKARLLRDDYCDGLGDCLPSCPVGAISFEEREALDYNEEEVKKNMKEKNTVGCPGTNVKMFNANKENSSNEDETLQISQLRQWPVQIKLVPVNASYFSNADVLIAADCTAYAYGGFHSKFLKGRIALIGCPKLDNINYSEKLSEIFKNNSIKSISVVRMEVPCCRGLEFAVKEAIEKSGKNIPLNINVISTDGNLVS